MIKFDIDRLREITDTLSRNKSRTFLTGFGVFWGVFMLVGLIGGGDGLKQLLSNNFQGFASNSAMIWAQPTTKPYHGFQKGRVWTMTRTDIERLRHNVPELDAITPAITRWGSNATYEDRKSSGILKGITPEMRKVVTPNLRYGRYINEMDMAQGRKVCVIGKQVYKNLFTKGGDPCGQVIRIDSVYYSVVGVNYSDGGMHVNGNDESSIFVPLSLVQQVYNRGADIDLLYVTAKPGITMSDITDHIRTVIANGHDVDPRTRRA